MKNRYLGIFFCMIVFLFILFACGEINYKWYVITYLPESEGVNYMKSYPFKVQLLRFDIQKIYDRYNIVYRYSPYEIKYYNVSNWAVKPNEMLTDLLEKHIVSSNLAETVQRDYFDTSPDYVVTGNIEKIEKLDSGDFYYAHIAMNLSLIRYKDYQTIYQMKIDERKKIFKTETSFFVEGISAIISEKFSEFIKETGSVFERELNENKQKL